MEVDSMAKVKNTTQKVGKDYRDRWDKAFKKKGDKKK